MTEPLKPRFSQHDIVNSVMRKDWIYSIEIDPDSFEALLYIPTEIEAKPEDDLYEKSVALTLDENQKSHGYAMPITVPMIEKPEPQDGFITEQSGEDGSGDNGDTLTVRVGYDPVPVGSVLEWLETLHDNTHRRVWWYVHSSKSAGTTKAGVMHYLIPCRDYDNMLVG